MASSDNIVRSGGQRDFYGRDERGEDQSSHGRSGGSKSSAVLRQMNSRVSEHDDRIPEAAKPVARESGAKKNAFSKL
jgi:hypothetical protein